MQWHPVFSSWWGRVLLALALWRLGVADGATLDAQAGCLLVWVIGHCDTLDGPLVGRARQALDSNNVNLVLPWVRAEDEPQIRQVFDHVQDVRALGLQARALADQHFFETLVRVHRAGEGAPFTGLKPAGLDLGPAVPAADRSLETGAVDAVLQLLLDAVREGVHTRFQTALRQRACNPDDVPAGRQYVAAYVAYVHCVEKVWRAVHPAAAPGAAAHPPH
jgi:hypothetical protein